MCSRVDCCVAGSTLIAVAGHGTIAAADLFARHASGARFTALTVGGGAWIEDQIVDILCSPDPVPVARLVMDTGLSLVCTPDHAIIVPGVYEGDHEQIPAIDLKRWQALCYPLASAHAAASPDGRVVVAAPAVGWLPCKAVNVWLEQMPVHVYKIMLASQQAFIASGVLVQAGVA